MKPFSIKEHLEHPDREVVTREGRPVQIVYTELNDSDYPVVAIIGNWCPYKFTADGLFQAGMVTKYDLFFANERREGWAIIFKQPLTGSFELSPEIYATKEAAVRTWEANPGIKCSIVKIKWEE